MSSDAHTPTRPADGTVLAFDFGLKRIGVAVGELAHGIAHPLDTIAFEDNARRFDAIDRIVREWQPARMVVGMPQSEGSAAHPMQAPINRFVRRLKSRYAVEIETIDEHLSSWEASRTMSHAGKLARHQKDIIDTMAAREILQTWFEEYRLREVASAPDH